MSKKILVIDDSATIQKVIGITLAKQPYGLVSVMTEEQLAIKLEQGPFDLVLLDINFSNSKDLVTLTNDIRKVLNDVPILAMLGAFDSVDEEAFIAAAIADKIVKPFESDKFIRKCQALINNEKLETTSDIKENIHDDSDQNNKYEEDWIIDSPTPVETILKQDDFTTDIIFDDNLNDVLSSELKSWEIEVPNVIGKSSSNIRVPNKITLQKDDEVKIQLTTNEKFNDSQPQSRLISLDELLPEQNNKDVNSAIEEFEIEAAIETPANFSLSENDLGEEAKEDFINKQEEDSTNFWAIDESVEQVKEQVDVVDLTEEILELPVEEILTQTQKEDKDKQVSLEKLIDHDLLRDQIMKDLSIKIEKTIKDASTKIIVETIERIAWEVIPDLAENIIKKEIKEISDKIKEE